VQISAKQNVYVERLANNASKWADPFLIMPLLSPFNCLRDASVKSVVLLLAVVAALPQFIIYNIFDARCEPLFKSSSLQTTINLFSNDALLGFRNKSDYGPFN
jgi:hypothetical protein